MDNWRTITQFRSEHSNLTMRIHWDGTMPALLGSCGRFYNTCHVVDDHMLVFVRDLDQGRLEKVKLTLAPDQKCIAVTIRKNTKAFHYDDWCLVDMFSAEVCN